MLSCTNPINLPGARRTIEVAHDAGVSVIIGAYILQFCSAALIPQDHTVLDEFTMWLRDLLAVRNVPAGTIRTSYQSIAAVLGGGFPKTTTMLAAAATLI